MFIFVSDDSFDIFDNSLLIELPILFLFSIFISSLSSRLITASSLSSSSFIFFFFINFIFFFLFTLQFSFWLFVDLQEEKESFNSLFFKLLFTSFWFILLLSKILKNDLRELTVVEGLFKFFDPSFFFNSLYFSLNFNTRSSACIYLELSLPVFSSKIFLT